MVAHSVEFGTCWTTVKEHKTIHILNMIGLWALLALITRTGQAADKAFPLEMANCTNLCQCWFRNDTSWPLLRPTNCLTFCSDDHTKPCFDWTKCRVLPDTCQLFCGGAASSYKCVARDYSIGMDHKSQLLAWLSYVGYGLLGVLCVLGLLFGAMKVYKFRLRT